MNKDALYTTKQIAALLQKSVPAISQYVKSGKLTPVEDRWGGHRGNLFRKEDVEQLRDELAQQQPDGWMTGEAADALGVSRTVLLSYLNEGLLPYKETTWRNRSVKVINPHDVASFQVQHKERLEQDKRKQRRFFNRQHQIAFFQKHTSPSVRDARLVLQENNEWGFWLIDENQTIPYEEGIYRYQLIPAYELSLGKKATAPGYVKLILPLSSPLTRLFFDMLYMHTDIANVYVDIKPERITVYTKDVLLETGDQTEMLAHFLTDHILEGFIQSNTNQIRLTSPDETLTITLPLSVKQQLKQQAAATQTTMQELARTIITAHIEEN